MQRVRLPPTPESIEQRLYELGCTREQVEKHLTALRHQQETRRLYPTSNRHEARPRKSELEPHDNARCWEAETIVLDWRV